MTHILDNPVITLLQGEIPIEYERFIQDDGSINYIPKTLRLYPKMFIVEYLFLPIEREIFNNTRDKQFYGYRYYFASPYYSALYMHGINYAENSISMLQLEMNVHRFRYYVNKKGEVIVDRVCDPLYPAYLMSAKGTADRLGDAIIDEINVIVQDLNAFYLDRRV